MIGFHQQSDRDLGADAGAGMLEGSPPQRDGSAVSHDRENKHSAEVPEHCGVERQMQDLAWLLPVLDRPEDQRSVERFHLDPPTPRARADSVAAIWPPGSALGAKRSSRDYNRRSG